MLIVYCRYFIGDLYEHRSVLLQSFSGLCLIHSSRLSLRLFIIIATEIRVTLSNLEIIFKFMSNIFSLTLFQARWHKNHVIFCCCNISFSIIANSPCVAFTLGSLINVEPIHITGIHICMCACMHTHTHIHVHMQEGLIIVFNLK